MQRNGLRAGGVGYEFNVVVLANAPRAGLEPADPLPEAVDALGGAGLLQAGGDLDSQKGGCPSVGVPERWRGCDGLLTPMAVRFFYTGREARTATSPGSVELIL